MATNLPTDIDATFPDRDPGDAEHQRHHDAIHAYTNEHDTATDPHGDRAYADSLQIHVGSRVYLSAAKSVAHNAETVLPFAGETRDSANLHDTATNNSRLTVPVGYDGVWLLFAQVQFEANATGVRNLTLRADGASTVAVNGVSAAASGVTRVNVTALPYLTAGQYIELTAYQSSGVTLGITPGSGISWMAAAYLGS